ncbi:MAG: AmmeMemoRadiSam system protein B [Thermoplasmata archaeon]|nr:MAG: AmmeMemoRadiSam system protein B [Thermoplasmata archaeon]
MRAPIVAGRFYPGSASSLKDGISESFLHRLGPGKMPEFGSARRKLKGLVVPHAGYVYSGPIAAHSFFALVEDGFPETFVIIGPNHSGMGKSVAVTNETFKTPLGEVPVDVELADQITRGIIENSSVAHKREHSVEVQLPFLQYFRKDIKFVPITMFDQSFKASKELGETIGEACQDRDVVIIASSDFTHCGFMYSQFIPPGKTAGEYAKIQDDRAIEQILELNPQGLINTVKKQEITMCGYGCVAAMMYASLAKGAKKAELLQYATSYDIEPSENAVGYGAIKLE